MLCFLRWHTKICAKGLLLTNERAGKKCGRIALFFSLSCSQAVEGRGEGGRGKTTGISQPGHRHAHVLLKRTHVARICHVCLGIAFVLPDSFASADDCECRLLRMMSLRLLYALAQAMLCLLLLLVLSFARRVLSAAVCLLLPSLA